MTSKEILKLVNENPAFHLATVDGDQPRVRGMLLFRADENGFIFHTASTKDVFRQMKENPKAEMCFSCGGTQIRVTGVMEQVFDEELRAEIFAHPSRKFLQAWVANGIDNLLQVFIMKDCSAVTWTMETNFEPKKTIELK
ncbi:MAG: pyridoxamine 5'-phosphate oxidase family protein [Oscillospiraceae bacterium]|nr:pyridoxamine 5'-phosphate oxidase family protein [Oscillospiraceae bacterium]MBQ5315890.1 pyridoxamine 5'-phosphate oxidase family protein [Oscillospiraceae bacterium]MBQ8726991.1 pyridoxamine 5'-phosphate oxidase family protein [Oscillospiraceae bacterium]